VDRSIQLYCCIGKTGPRQAIRSYHSTIRHSFGEWSNQINEGATIVRKTSKKPDGRTRLTHGGRSAYARPHGPGYATENRMAAKEYIVGSPAARRPGLVRFPVASVHTALVRSIRSPSTAITTALGAVHGPHTARFTPTNTTLHALMAHNIVTTSSVSLSGRNEADFCLPTTRWGEIVQQLHK
jgi:phosphoenolpyruvate carboxylase